MCPKGSFFLDSPATAQPAAGENSQKSARYQIYQKWQDYGEYFEKFYM